MKLAAHAKISTLFLTGLLPAALFGAVPPTAPAEQQPAAVVAEEVRHYPGKIAGDNAFKEQSFTDAARFYDSYLKEAEL